MPHVESRPDDRGRQLLATTEPWRLERHGLDDRSMGGHTTTKTANPVRRVEPLLQERYRRVPLVPYTESRQAHIHALSTAAAPGRPLRLASRRRRRWIARLRGAMACLAIAVTVLMLVAVLRDALGEAVLP